MPDYDYRCPACGEELTETHGMLAGPKIICGCGETMAKVLQAPAVMWGGLRPSQGEIHPNIRAMGTQRETFQKEHEAHEYRSGN